jgi:hypothetical protein
MMRRRARTNATRLVLWTSVAGALGALSSLECGPKTPGIEGFACSSDGDCNSGLQCLPYQVPAEGGGVGTACASEGKQCLRPCRSNADCVEGPGLTCVTFCGSGAACEATADLNLSRDAAPD